MDSYTKPKKTGMTRVIDQGLKLIVTALAVVWLLIPGVLGWLGGKVDTRDIVLESFVFAVDEIIGPTATMIAMARVLVALAAVAALYRDDVSDFLGLELYGPRMLARLLAFLGGLMYLIAFFIHWTHLSGGF